MKPKIVIWSDFVAPTGFANVAKNLFDELYLYYDVTIIAINYYGNKKYDTSKYFIYSASKDDVLNKKNLVKAVTEEQPDIVLLFQDSFHIAEVIDTLKTASPNSKIVSYFPVDAADYSVAWKNVLEKSDILFGYTDWASSIIHEAIPEIKKPIHKLYHGVDTSIFKPLPDEVIKKLRQASGWFNKFVVINVNRFQPRKAIPLSIRAFSMFSKGYKICKCGNWYPIHRNTCDLNGCAGLDVIEVVNNKKNDVYYYLHMMQVEPSMGLQRTNLLQHHLMISGFTDKDYGKIIGINSADIYGGAVPESTLNDVYNCANINLSTTNGEGCGLSLIEAAACGTKSIAPNNSAIPEILKGTGILINNVAVYSHPNDNAFMRPIVDVKEMVKALEAEYREWKSIGKEKVKSQACIDLVNTNYLWNDKRDLLLQTLQSINK